MTDIQLYLAIGVPILFNAAMPGRWHQGALRGRQSALRRCQPALRRHARSLALRVAPCGRDSGRTTEASRRRTPLAAVVIIAVFRTAGTCSKKVTRTALRAPRSGRTGPLGAVLPHNRTYLDMAASFRVIDVVSCQGPCLLDVVRKSIQHRGAPVPPRQHHGTRRIRRRCCRLDIRHRIFQSAPCTRGFGPSQPLLRRRLLTSPPLSRGIDAAVVRCERTKTEISSAATSRPSSGRKSATSRPAYRPRAMPRRRRGFSCLAWRIPVPGMRGPLQTANFRPGSRARGHRDRRNRPSLLQIESNPEES